MCIHTHTYTWITLVCLYIYIYRDTGCLHSAKGGAVETGCSDLYDVICCFTIQYYPNPLHPRSTAPPSAEYPG